MRRCTAVGAACAIAASVLTGAPSASAQPRPPGACTYQPPAAQAKFPGVARTHSLAPADFAGSWTITSVPDRFTSGLTATETDGLEAYSHAFGGRSGAAPSWSIDQSLYRYVDANRAAAVYQTLVARIPCRTFGTAEGPTTQSTSPDGTVEQTVFRATSLRQFQPPGLSSSVVWIAVVHSGTMVGAYSVSSAGTLGEVRAAAGALDALGGAAATRLVGAVPAVEAVAFPIDTSRRAPKASEFLRPGDLGPGWRRVDHYSSFAGGLDDGATAGTTKCQPVDFPVVATGVFSYVAPGEDRRKVAAGYENVAQLGPGQGTRFMTHVRNFVRIKCSRYRFIAGRSVEGVGDDALVLGPAFGYKGGRGVILVRNGDKVAAFGFSGPVDKTASVLFRERVARRMAARMS